MYIWLKFFVTCSQLKYKCNPYTNAGKENSSGEKTNEEIAFINFDCTAFIRDSLGATVIIDTGASSHMTLHQSMLKNYQSFPKLRMICAANKCTFNALGIAQLKLNT